MARGGWSQWGKYQDEGGGARGRGSGSDGSARDRRNEQDLERIAAAYRQGGRQAAEDALYEFEF